MVSKLVGVVSSLAGGVFAAGLTMYPVTGPSFPSERAAVAKVGLQGHVQGLSAKLRAEQPSCERKDFIVHVHCDYEAWDVFSYKPFEENLPVQLIETFDVDNIAHVRACESALDKMLDGKTWPHPVIGYGPVGLDDPTRLKRIEEITTGLRGYNSVEKR